MPPSISPYPRPSGDMAGACAKAIAPFAAESAAEIAASPASPARGFGRAERAVLNPPYFLH